MRPTTKARHDKVHSLYKVWCAKTYEGSMIYSNSYIMIKIGEEVHLAPATVERILFSKT
ncbi:hypothetical protein N8Z33_00975 [Flavobacteriaceae bacterium]|nr:hypothetical protein [Flavobacteriaceae bacterium]MDC1285240.1 hypothetical protein [Flavobacteriaceae bacterium]